MGSFSNITPKFANNLHLLVDSITLCDAVAMTTIKALKFVRMEKID